MNLLVHQIIQKQKTIKEFMQKTWVKLEELENTYKKLKVAKLPLITFSCNYNGKLNVQ